MEVEIPRRPPTGADGYIIEIYNDLETFPTPLNFSIYKVPTQLRSVNEDAYTPDTVSIGPFHHGDENLKPMEDQKRLFLLSLLLRTGEPKAFLGLVIKDCFKAILDLDTCVRACYAEPIKHDKYELAKILLYDAGFMLELFFRQDGVNPGDTKQVSTTYFMKKDLLPRDLALLENQIPWSVLETLFKIIVSYRDEASCDSLEKRALRFFRLHESSKKYTMEWKHLLHLLHVTYCPLDLINSTRNQANPTDSTNIPAEWEFIPCATSLRQVGVVFQRSETNLRFNLKFERGKFKIPCLFVEKNNDSLLRNLLAFEQCQEQRHQYVTSYFMLMDQLIDTADDVKLLQQKRIITSYLGREDDVLNLFNNFFKQVIFPKFYYVELCKEVNAYAKSRRQRSIAALQRYITALRHDYFKNPWTIIALMAAVILLVLTFLQTLYTVRSYYHS